MSVSVCMRACLSVCLGQNVLKELVVGLFRKFTLHLRAGVEDALVCLLLPASLPRLPLLASLLSGSNRLPFFCFPRSRGEYSPCTAMLETQPSVGSRLAPLLISENGTCPSEGEPPGVARGKLF